MEKPARNPFEGFAVDPVPLAHRLRKLEPDARHEREKAIREEESKAQRAFAQSRRVSGQALFSGVGFASVVEFLTDPWGDDKLEEGLVGYNKMLRGM